MLGWFADLQLVKYVACALRFRLKSLADVNGKVADAWAPDHEIEDWVDTNFEAKAYFREENYEQFETRAISFLSLNYAAVVVLYMTDLWDYQWNKLCLKCDDSTQEEKDLV